MPKRIQLKRTKGWRLPANAVSVARPTLYGNPHKVGAPDTPTPQAAVAAYRDFIAWGGVAPADIEKLRGKDLACWCPLDAPCHADVLIRIANDEHE